MRRGVAGKAFVRGGGSGKRFEGKLGRRPRRWGGEGKKASVTREVR